MHRSLGVLFAIAGQLSIAHADDVARQQARAAAEAFEKAAKTTGDPAKSVECGQAYLDLYNKDPSASDADEIVYNAAVCFEQGASVGVAITLHKQITTTWPRSKVAPRAQGRLAKLYERAGQFAQAADALEVYATKYAGEKDAVDALSDAVALRRALGDEAKQLADTEQFVRLYGAKRPKEAADAAFGLVAVYARRGADAKEKALRDYLKRFASAGTDEQAMRAYIELGETLWERACKVKQVDGLCMTIVRDRTLPLAPRKVKATPAAKRCGAATTTRAIVARDPKLVDEAMKMFAQGESAFGRLASPSGAASYWRVRGKLVVADRELETFLAIAFPTDLDFSPDKVKTKERSLLKFNDYIAAKQKTGAKASDQYTAILGLKDASGSLAAAARLGQLSQDFAHQLATAEIPKDIRTGEYAKDKVEAFCDKLDEVAEPLAMRAIQSYDVCLQKASELGVIDKSSQLCARERAALGPSTFAISEEMVPPVPLHLPVLEEEPVRAGNQSQAFRDALKAFTAATGPQPLGAPKCAQLTRSFTDIATKEKSADAWFMAGLAHGRCNQLAQAKTAYGTALKLDAKHARSVSNLGELAHRAGDLATARTQWEQALAIDAKLFAARVGLASLALRDLRTATTTNRAKLEQDVQTHAASAMAVGNDTHPAPYVQLAILALGKSQLPMAYYLLSRAAGISDVPYAELARGAARVAEGYSGLASVEHAARMPQKIDETNLALAIEQLRVRKYNDAGNTLALVKTRSYDVLIARGVAARGTGKLADAEARYSEAIALDASRPEAHFNLGVLWKDYTAARATDPTAAKAAFKKAADSFRRVGTADAKALADDCDKAAAKL